MMKIKNYITLLLFFFTSCLHAQDFKHRIKEMRSDYEQSKTLQIVMEITVYESEQSSRPHYQQTVEVKRDGNKYWYKVEENEMLLNEKYLIMVDNHSRQISYTLRNLAAEAELQKGFQFNLDSILTKYETSQYLGKRDSTEHYLVVEKTGPIEKIHFFIYPQDNTLKEVAYNYREGQYASIRFITFDKNASFEPDTFSEERYMTRVDNKIVPSEFFKQYNINNQ